MKASSDKLARRPGKGRAALLGLLALWTVAGCGSGGGAKSSGAPASKAQAPAFNLPDLTGKKSSLADYRGKIVLLDFWATWCPPCRQSIPALRALQKEYAGKDVVVLGVSLDEDPGLVPDFVKEEGIEYPILLGGASDVSLQYGIRGIPAMYLLDKEGKIVRRWIGYDTPMQKEWREGINALLAT